MTAVRAVLFMTAALTQEAILTTSTPDHRALAPLAWTPQAADTGTS
ncbi:MAG: hypothetical protein ACJ8DY_05700 [Xanthobacteraceae bacterium]